MTNNFAETIRFHVCREAVYNNSGKFVKSEYYINFVAKYDKVEISLFNRLDLQQAKETYRFCKSLRTESRDIGAMITCGEFPNEIK